MRWALALTALVLVAGCARPDRVASDYAGSWSACRPDVREERAADCTRSLSRFINRVAISVGGEDTGADLVLNQICSLEFDLSGGRARARPGQLCRVADFPDGPLSNFEVLSWEIDLLSPEEQRHLVTVKDFFDPRCIHIVDQMMFTAPSCQREIRCGDGVVAGFAGEQCDDGNDVVGDGCSSCRREVCGDGRPGINEACDGESNCYRDCTWSTCGDGVEQAGELCHAPTRDAVAFADAEAQAAGDLDGDGDRDAITLNRQLGLNLAVHINTGLGGEGALTTHRYLVSEHFVGPQVRAALALADLDADGDLDAVMNTDAGNDVAIAWNEGRGAFARVSRTRSLSGVDSLALGDLDGDGDPDLVVGSTRDSSLALHMNDGGVLAPASPIPLANPFAVGAVALGDLDGDGKLDIVAGGVRSESKFPDPAVNVGILVPLLHRGDGGFQAQGETRLPERVSSLVLADLDQDGDLDPALAIANRPLLHSLRNLGGGRLGSPSSLPLSSEAAAVVAADLDEDGDVELIAQLATRIEVLHNVAPNAFLHRLALELGTDIAPVVLDLNGDGRPELATWRTTAGIIWSSR